MDKIEKVLNKLDSKLKRRIKNILFQIDEGNFRHLDLKRLRGKKDIFRVRKGDIRIIFHKVADSVKILSIERRNSKTYRKR